MNILFLDIIILFRYNRLSVNNTIFNGINSKIFEEKLATISSRQSEYEGKKIIFTPNAFSSLLLALDYAKESGSVGIQPEHVILGILKSKKGIAYKILSEAITNAVDFEDVVLKKLNDKIPETLAILRLAKEEARSLNCETVGTEMILLGILSYGAGVAAETLRRLGISLKDAFLTLQYVRLLGFAIKIYAKSPTHFSRRQQE